MIESYVSVQRFCFKSLYVSTMCLIADMETIPQMKSAGTPEKSRLPALLGAGDERIELPLRVLETPVIPFDQSPVPVPDLNRSLDIYITAGSILSIVILKKLLFYRFAKTEKISQKKSQEFTRDKSMV